MFVPKLEYRLQNKNHLLDGFFEIKNIIAISSKKGNVTQYKENMIICNNLNGLIDFVKECRQIDSDQVNLKFGIDGGGGFLKVTLSIQVYGIDTDSERKRQTYDDGVTAKKMKDSGVKKIFLIGIAEKMEELYENVDTVWTILNIRQFYDATISTDLKLANVLSGIMSHASCYPCTWCTAKNGNLDSCGEYRTIGDCVENFESWKRAGSNKKDAHNYKNCINPPIYSVDKDREIIDIISPPELHLLLGAVNHIYKHMLVEFEEESLKWATQCNVSREIFNKSPSFAGNACKTLLEKVDILRSYQNLGCLKYVQCFQDFREVVHSCFGSILDPKFTDHINNFRKSFLDLNISVTPKIHAVFYHIEYFCNKSKRALGYYSEQSVESVHADFKKTWQKYKAKKDNANFCNNLLKAVREYNSQHI